jgi:MoxR-like ATPase
VNSHLGNDDDDVRQLGKLADAVSKLRSEIARVVVGQDEVVTELLVALLSGGHALLVGVPGLAKTLLVSSLAACLDLNFGRVQFTPDLLPADITGTDVLEQVERDGRLRHETAFLPGPIFANIVLADEINRTPPKTQAALLQAMQEGHVTVGGRTHALPRPFQVLATQNPIEQEGTYLLPEAQLDRFLLEVRIDYPSQEEETEIARRSAPGDTVLQRVVTADEVLAFGRLIPRVPITQEALELAVQLTRRSRPGQPGAPADVARYVRFGAGPRGTRALVLAAKAHAALFGKPVADLEQVRIVARPALRHRLVLGYRAEAEGVTADDLVSRLLGPA